MHAPQELAANLNALGVQDVRGRDDIIEPAQRVPKKVPDPDGESRPRELPRDGGDFLAVEEGHLGARQALGEGGGKAAMAAYSIRS